MTIPENILDNRELAILIWLFVLFLLAITKKKIRSTLGKLIKSLFQKAVITLSLILVFYVGAIVYIFHLMNFWDMSNLSETIIWFFGIAYVMLVNINHASEDGFFKKVFIDNLKLVAFLEFVINLYVFKLWIELILVPIMAFLGALLGVSSTDSKYRQVEKILTGIVGILGLGFLSFAIFSIITDFQGFISLSNFREFLLPIILTVLSFPIIYIMALYVIYELLFVRINYMVKKSDLERTVKLKTLLAFHFNLKALNNWSRKISMFNFNDKDDIDEAIKKVKTAKNISD